MMIRRWLVFVTLAVIWGSAWIATATLDEYVPPLRGAAVRYALSALLCLPAVLLGRRVLPSRRVVGLALLLSLTLIDLPLGLLLWARTLVSSATVIVLFAAMPLVVGFLTPDAPQRALLAAAVGWGGVCLALGAPFSLSQAGGAAILLIAVVSAGGSALLARRAFKDVDPWMAAGLVLGLAALLLFPASLALERAQPAIWNRGALGSILFLAALGGAPAYASYLWLLQQMEAYQAVTLQWLEPLVAMIEGALLLRAALSLPMIAGAIVTLVSLGVVMGARAKDDETVSLVSN